MPEGPGPEQLIWAGVRFPGAVGLDAYRLLGRIVTGIDVGLCDEKRCTRFVVRGEAGVNRPAGAEPDGDYVGSRMQPGGDIIGDIARAPGVIGDARSEHAVADLFPIHIHLVVAHRGHEQGRMAGAVRQVKCLAEPGVGEITVACGGVVCLSCTDPMGRPVHDGQQAGRPAGNGAPGGFIACFVFDPNLPEIGSVAGEGTAVVFDLLHVV